MLAFERCLDVTTYKGLFLLYKNTNDFDQHFKRKIINKRVNIGFHIYCTVSFSFLSHMVTFSKRCFSTLTKDLCMVDQAESALW